MANHSKGNSNPGQWKELMIELGMGVKYVYNPVNGTGDVLVVEITPEEVAAM